MKAIYFQNDFSAGMMPPSMAGRFDSEAYQRGAELIENGLIHPSGAIVKRPPWAYAGAYGPIDLTVYRASGQTIKIPQMIVGNLKGLCSKVLILNYTRITPTDYAWVGESLYGFEVESLHNLPGYSKGINQRPPLLANCYYIPDNLRFSNSLKLMEQLNYGSFLGINTNSRPCIVLSNTPGAPYVASLFTGLTSLYPQQIETAFGRRWIASTDSIAGSLTTDFRDFTVGSGAIKLVFTKDHEIYGFILYKNVFIFGGNQGIYYAEIDPVTITNSKIEKLSNYFCASEMYEFAGGVFFVGELGLSIKRISYSNEAGGLGVSTALSINEIELGQGWKFQEILCNESIFESLYCVAIKEGSDGTVVDSKIVVITKNLAYTVLTVPRMQAAGGPAIRVGIGEEHFGPKNTIRLCFYSLDKIGSNYDNVSLSKYVLTEFDENDDPITDLRDLTPIDGGPTGQEQTFALKIRSLPVEAQTQNGLSLGQKKIITKLSVRYKDTKNIKFGAYGDAIYEQNFETEESGTLEESITSSFDNQKNIYIESNDANSATIQYIRAEMEVSDL